METGFNYSLNGKIENLITKGTTDTDASIGTTWTYTGVSVTIPAQKAFGIYAWQTYNEAAPTGIAFNSISNTTFRDYQSVIFSTGGFGSITGYNDSNNSITYYVWGKANSAGNNQCHATYWYM